MEMPSWEAWQGIPGMGQPVPVPIPSPGDGIYWAGAALGLRASLVGSTAKLAREACGRQLGHVTSPDRSCACYLRLAGLWQPSGGKFFPLGAAFCCV